MTKDLTQGNLIKNIITNCCRKALTLAMGYKATHAIIILLKDI